MMGVQRTAGPTLSQDITGKTWKRSAWQIYTTKENRRQNIRDMLQQDSQHVAKHGKTSFFWPERVDRQRGWFQRFPIDKRGMIRNESQS